MDGSSRCSPPRSESRSRATSWTGCWTWPSQGSPRLRTHSGPCSGARLPDVGWAEVTGRLLLAAALGGAVGLERELHEREAGLRTHLLVSVGAAPFTLVSAYAWTDFHFTPSSGITCDPTRIAAQTGT